MQRRPRPRQTPTNRRMSRPALSRRQNNMGTHQINEHTSRLAELLADDKDLVKILNSTTANHTFFALTNHALEGLPRRNSPNPKFMSSLLRYHILPGRLSIEHIAGHGTLPTKLTEPALESRLPQRIVVREHHNGVMLNRGSRVVAADMVSKIQCETQPWDISCMVCMAHMNTGT